MSKVHKLALSIAALGASLVALPIYADAIIDPYNQGHTAVYSLSGDQDDQFRVGGFGGNGAFELNSESQTNGITALTRTALNIGGSGNTGLVRVVGDGNAGSAQLTINPGAGIRNVDGTLQIIDGGVVHSGDDIFLGQQGFEPAPSETFLVVEGQGSVLRTRQSSTGETWERDGGRMYVGFNGQSDNTVNIINGGTVEALSGKVGDSGDDGSIWLGVSSDEGSTTTVNVDGEGSVLRADHYIEIGNRTEVNTSSQLNVTDGARVEVLSSVGTYPGALVVSDTLGNADVLVSGATGGGSTIEAETILLGGRGIVKGFTSNGDPVSYSRVDEDDLVDGQQAQDIDGNLLYDQNGNPLVAREEEPFPDYFYTTTAPIYTKNSGNLTVENGGVVQVSGDIEVSTDTYDPVVDQNLVSLQGGQQSSLTVRSGGTVNAANVVVKEDGRLDGGDGTINANVIVNGGTIAPGDSPGTMTVFGDFMMEDGELELEFDPFGTSDLLDVRGDAYFGSGALISFLLYDQPDTTVDISGLIKVGGNSSYGDGFSVIDNFVFDFLGEDPVDALFDFQFEDQLYNYDNGTLALADSGGPVDVPEPSTLGLLGIGLLGLLQRKRRYAKP